MCVKEVESCKSEFFQELLLSTASGPLKAKYPAQELVALCNKLSEFNVPLDKLAKESKKLLAMHRGRATAE